MILNYDKNGNKTWGISNLIDGLKSAKKEVPALNSELQKLFSQNANKTFSQVVSTGQLQNVQDTNFLDFVRSYTAEMKEAQKAELSFAEVSQAYNDHLVASGQTITQVSSKMIGFKNIISGIGTSLLTTFTLTAVFAGIGMFIKMIDDAVHHSERLIEAGRKAQEEINKTRETTTKASEFQTENAKDFSKLREGINPKTNQNVSLTNEEYEKYIELSNQVAEIYPSVVSSYDAQGNAILNLSSNAGEANQQLQDLLATQKQIAGVKISENLDKVITGAMEDASVINGKIQAVQDRIRENEVGQETFSNLSLEDYINGFIDGTGEKELVLEGEAISAVEDALTEADIPWRQINSPTDENAVITLDLVGHTMEDIKKAAEDFNGTVSDSGLATTFGQRLSEYNVELSGLRQELDAVWNGVSQDIIDSFEANPVYNALSDELKNGINSVISSIDYDTLKKPSDATWEEYLKSTYLYPMTAIFGEAEKLGTSATPQLKSAKEALENILTIDTGKQSAQQYENKLQGYLDTLHDFWVNSSNQEERDRQQEYYEQFVIHMGFRVENPDGTISDISQTDHILANLRDYFGPLGEDLEKELTSLSLDQLIQVEDIATSFGFAGTIADAIKKVVDGVKSEIEKDGTLDSIFKDETYQTNAESYEKSLSSLTGALETIRTEGKLTAEQMRDLQEEFPDMTDFSKEMISDNAMKVLGEWIGEFKDDIDTMTPEGLKQLQTYVENLTTSFGDLDVSSEEALSAIKSNIVTADSTQVDDFRRQTAQAETMFDDLISQIEAEGGEVNYQVIWELAMMDRFSDPAADIYQEYNNRKLYWDIEIENEKAAKEIQDRIDKRNAQISRQQAANRTKEAGGEVLNPMDYADILANQQSNRDDAEAISRIWGNAFNRLNVAEQNPVVSKFFGGITKQLKDTVFKNLMAADQALSEAEQAVLETVMEQRESGANATISQLNNDKASTEKLKTKVESIKNDGNRVVKGLYDQLADSYDQEAQKNEWLYNFYQTLADTSTGTFKTKFQESANGYLEAANTARTNADEARRGYDIDQLTEYQNAYTDLQTIATKSQEEITKAETNHQKVSEKVYNDLIKNGNDQIKNMQDQQRTLRDLQKQVAYGSDTWRDYQSQIDEVDRSIEQMQLNQLGWAETAQSLISTNASELSSVLSSAMSEMNSETGLTIDTMNELKRQFSDLAGYDVSNIFYQSADGMKFNTEAAEALVDAEYELQTNALYDTIAQQKSIMEQYGDSTTDAAQKAVSAAEQRIGAAERELSMLQALYNQQKESLTQYQAWQNAQQTENAGAHYEGLQGYLETATKAYDQGMTGTDDFREYVRYFDEWGEDTVSAYERNIEKMKRYLTDDYQGVKNFYDDLVKNGFGTHENGIYDINMPSVEEAAHTMGMSQEWLRDMMSRGEDYGFTNDWVSSELEGRLKIKDATQKMIDEQLRYNQAERDGAGEEILKEVSDNINTYSNSIHNLSGNIDDVVAREGKISAKQIQNAVSDIESLTGMIDQVKSDQSQGLISDSYAQDQIDLINQNIKSYAQDHHIPFMLDIDGNVVIDKDTLDSQFEGWEEEIKITPVLPTNEDIMGLELTGDTQTDSVIQGLQTTLDTANGLDEEMTNLFGTIQGYSGEDLDKVVFGDKQYQNKELETALDGVLNKLGLGQEYGNALVGVLKEVLSLDEQTQGKMYDYGSEQYNESTGTRVTNLQGELKSESIPVDIDFDTSIMKADELKSKLEELKNVQRQNMNQSFLSDEASNELNTLISSTQKQYKIQLGVEAIQGQGITLDQFLRLSQEEQKQMLVDVNMNDDEYEQFVASVEGQTIKAQIEAQIDSGSTSIQELNSLTGDELQDKIVELGIDVTGLEDAQELESIISTISSESTEVNVRIADDQMATLTSGDVEVGANTDAAEKAIDAVEKRADNAEGEMTVKANTDPATSAVNSAVSYINSQNPIIHVDADASSLNSTIEMVLAPTRTITVHANVTGLPGGGGGTVGVDGVNNNGFAFASGTEDDKVIPVAHNNDTLVGEEGYEIHVDRDRRSWSVIGQNGPEFRDDIEPGDIVFNHAQSVRLLKNGHTNTRGKALAGGQQQISGLSRLGPANSMLADSGGSSTNSTNLDRWNKESSQALSGLTTAAKDATAATKANTGAKNDEKEETEKTKSALEKLKDWITEFVDWVDNRIDSLTTKIDRLGKAAENATGYLNKNAKLNQAQKTLADNRTYQNALNGKMLQTNARGEAVKATGGTNKTLLFDTARGAVKYQKQADKILNKARKDGLINKKQLNMIKKQVANGSINIKKYNENVRGVIESYEEWFKKSQDLVSSMDDLVAQYKELQQTKLDNIVEEFESLANYSKSISQTSQAIVSLSESRGDTANSKGTMQQYANQIALEKQVQGYYNAEMKAYWAEMQNAAKVFGVDSNEYRSAQEAYEGMATALKESEKNAIDLKRALLDLNLKPMEYALNRLKAVGDRLSDVVSLKNARGTMRGQPSSAITTDDYMAQIKNANDQRVQLEERAEYNRRMLDIMNYAKGTAKWDELGGSEKWDELQTAIEQDEAAIRQMEISNEDLKKSIRTLRWKKFTDLQKILTDTISDFDHLKGLFNQEEFFDDDGEGWGITNQGYANIALIGAEYSTAINQIADYRKALEKLDEEVENHVISEEEYNETSREYVETIQKLVENTENYKDALIDMYKTQIQNENNAIQKNIDLRKEALAQQKAYYDYQKRVTEQTKQRNKVLSQLNSLEGVSNRQAKAQAARLREQLSQTDEELNDTKKNHRYDMLSQGYDKLSQDIQETLDQTLRHIQANSDEQDKIVAMMLNQVADHYNEAYDAIQQRIRETGTVVSEQTQATLNDPNLAQFFDTVDQSTLVPIDNWNQFTDAVTQAIDTSAIEMFATTSGEMLDTLTEKAKAYAKELANAANAQSNQGSTSGTGAPGSESSGGTQSVAQQKQSLQSQIANLEKQRQELKKEADKNLAYYENRTKRMNNNKKGSDAYKKNQLAAEKHKNNASKALMQVSQIEAQIEDLQRKLDSLPSYRTGTKRTLEDELALTHNKEIILGNGAILRQLPQGSQVLPKVQADNIWQWSKINPMDGLTGNIPTANVTTNNMGTNYYYGSLIQVNGNVDSNMLDQINDIAEGLLKDRNFMQKQFDYNTQNFKRAYNKRV